MDNKRDPIILLLEDEVTEYHNWKKWINLTNNKATLLYCADIESAVEEIKNNDVDIYLIDIFLAYGNGIDFLEIIRNKRGLKIAVTTTKDLGDVVKIYALGAIVINKQNNTKDCLKIVELVFSIWKMGIIADADYSDESLGAVTNEMITLGSKIANTNLQIEVIENEVEKMKLYILGNYEVSGLKGRIEDLENMFNDIKSKSNISFLIGYFERGGPLTKVVVSSLLILICVSLPILGLYKLFKG